MVAREHGKFKPAAEFSELSRFMSSPALRWDVEVPLDQIDRGQIDRVRLPTRVFHLALRRETGALMLRQGNRRKKIYFVEGTPEFVASTEKRELLGEYLIGRGQVLRMEVDMALAMLPRFGGRLGDALVGLGVLRPIELFRAVHDQTQERFIELFSWETGEIGFARGARSHEETFPLGVDPFDLVARGVRAGYSVAELEAILKPFEEDMIEAVAMPPVRLEQFRLPDREVAVIEAARARTTLAQLTAKLTKDAAADPDEVLRAVFIGLCCDLLRSPKWVIPPSQMPKSR
jgi:serine/threonine-protein kinase